MKTYMVVENQLPSIEVVLQKRVQQAVKHGWPVPTWNVQHADDRATPYGFERWLRIDIDIDQAMFGNWLPIFRVEHRQGQTEQGSQVFANELSYVNDVNFDVSDSDDEATRSRKLDMLGATRFYRSAPPHCDHCGKTRKRLETYVGISLDGQIKQFGTACLADATGITDASSMIGFLTLLHRDVQKLLAKPRPDHVDLDTSSLYIGVLPFLAAVAATIREDGWVTQAEATIKHKQASWTTAYTAIRKAMEHGGDVVAVQQRDLDLAEKALQWVRHEMSATSNWQLNVQRAAEQTTVHVRGLATLAWAISMYQPDADTAKKSSRFVGKVSDRISAEATILSSNAVKDIAWKSYCVRGQDAEGVVFVWFQSTSLEVGKRYHIHGRVKRHVAWRHVLENVLDCVSYT